MADEGISRQDIISDDALQAPLTAAANLDKMANAFDSVITKTKEMVKASDKNEDSLTDVTNLLTRLTQMEQSLVDVENKHAVTINKLTESQKKQNTEIEKLNKQLKEKKKNEEESAKAVDALDKTTGGLITRYKDLGKQMAALATNPWIAVAGILVGTFFALKNAAETYYNTSGDGEDRLAEKISASQAALNVLKNKWAEVGEVVDKAVTGKIGFWNRLLAEVFKLPPQLVKEMEDAANRAVASTKELDAIGDDLADTQVRRAQDEREIAELQYKANQKNLYSDKERLDFLYQSQSIRRGLIREEEDFADRDLAAIEEQVANRLEIDASDVRAMVIAKDHSRIKEDEYNKIVAAQVKIEQLRGKFFEEEKKNAAKISGIIQEQKTERTKAEEQRTKDLEIESKKRLDLEKNINNAEQQFQDDVYKNFRDNFQSQDDLLLEEWERKKEQAIYEAEAKKIQHDADVKYWTDLLNIAKQFGFAVKDLLDSIFSRKELQFDAEEKRIKDTLDSQLKALHEKSDAEQVATTEATRARDEQAFATAQKEKEYKDQAAKDTAELERKKREQARKTAVYDKVLTLAQAAINLSLAIIKAGPNPLAIALTTILGGIQIAAIAAKPIPALFKGARNWMGGLATVGDRGRELVQVPGALPFLAEQQTTMFLPPGTDVLTNSETEQAINKGIDYTRMGRAVAANIPDYLRTGTSIYKALRDQDGNVWRIRKNLFPYG